MSVQFEGHTLERFDGELHHLHVELLKMAGLVSEQVRMALESFLQQDLGTLHIVKEREYQVDALEKKIDSAIIEVLAKRGPVARDLRVIMAFSKMVVDLERIGDEAIRIANITTSVYDNEHNGPTGYLLRDVRVMAKLANASLKEAVEILDVLDLERAEKLLNSHDDLDEEFRTGLRRLATFVLEDARNVGHTINIVLILKSLERIGGHARNLAEYVVFLVSGEDIRHPKGDLLN